MRKRTLLFCLSLVLVIAVIALACAPKATTPATTAPATSAPATTSAPKTTAPATTAAPSKITLKFAHMWAITTDMHKNVQGFADKVKELSDGQVQIDIYPAEQLGKSSEATRIIQSGLADMGAIGYEPGRYPIGMGLCFTGLFRDGRAFTQGMRDLYAWSDTLKAEGKQGGNWQFMWPNFTVGYDFYTKKQVKTLADMKGMLIRSGGGTMDGVVNYSGAKVVSVAASEIYTALQRGTVDGAYYHPPSFVALKLWEVVKYGLKSGVQPTGGLYVVNIDSWNKLPKRIQNIIHAAIDWEEEGFVPYVWQNEKDALKKMGEMGVVMTPMNDADMASMRTNLAKVVDDWVRENPKAKEIVEWIKNYR